MSVTQVCPARNAGRGGVARGGIALTYGLTLMICIYNTFTPRPKVTSPMDSGVCAVREEVPSAHVGGAGEGSARGEV